MNFKMSPRLLKINAALLGLALISTSSMVYAGKSVFIRTKPHVRVEPPPIAVDIAVDSDGNIQGAIMPLHRASDVTLKRGIVGVLPGGDLTAIYDTELAQDHKKGAYELSVQIQHAKDDGLRSDGGDIMSLEVLNSAALSKSDPEWRYVPVRRTQGATDDGDFIVFDSAASGSDSTSIDYFTMNFEPIKFEPGRDEQLWGEPAYLFNTPAPGEELTAVLPALQPGDIFEQDLFVYNSERREPQRIHIHLQYQF